MVYGPSQAIADPHASEGSGRVPLKGRLAVADDIGFMPRLEFER